MRPDITTVDTEMPAVRAKLKAQIILAGYPTYGELANNLGVHHTQLSRILNGKEHPSPVFQRRLANELGLSLKELRALL